MRTTIKIDDKIAKELLHFSKQKSLPKAIQAALVEYIRLKKKQQLIDLAGKIDLHLDLEKLRSNREFNELDSD